MRKESEKIIVRNTRPEDSSGIEEMSLEIYPDYVPWSAKYIKSHIDIFPEGQFVAVEQQSGRVVGMASSLIISWDDYEVHGNWNYFTDKGLFTNHDPDGKTLYGAEVMVRTSMQGRGVGKEIYKARRELTERLGLLRIRAGARLPGYNLYAEQMSAEEYVEKVVSGEIGDRTLSFQLKQGFRVIAVIADYIPRDEYSLGHAAMIEWINPKAVGY